MRAERRPTILGLSPERASQPAAIDAPAPPPQGRPPRKPYELRRDFARWPLPPTVLRIILRQPGGGPSTLTLPARNLSCSGVGLLHRHFAHPGSEADLVLRALDGSWTRLSGSVVHSGHRGGIAHDLGIRFHDPIDVRSFVRRTPVSGHLTYEKVRPADIEGRVAIIEPDPVLRRLLRAQLASTRTTPIFLDTAEDLAQLRGTPVGVVLCPASLAAAHPAAMTLVREGLPGAGLVLTADAIDAAGLAGSAAPRFDLLLPKPFDEQVFLRTLAEFLLPIRDTHRSAA